MVMDEGVVKFLNAELEETGFTFNTGLPHHRTALKPTLGSPPLTLHCLTCAVWAGNPSSKSDGAIPLEP